MSLKRKVLIGILLAMPMAAQDRVHIWIRGFVPNDASYVRNTPAGNQIYGDAANGCFASDGRTFSVDPQALSRVSSDVVLVLQRGADGTVTATKQNEVNLVPAVQAVDCISGSPLPPIQPSGGSQFGPVPQGNVAAAVQLPVDAATGSPTSLPRSRYSGSFRYIPAWNRLEFEGSFSGDSAYEAYGQLNNGPVQTLLRIPPPSQLGLTSNPGNAIRYTAQLGPINLSSDQVRRTVWTTNASLHIANQSAWDQTVLAGFAYWTWQSPNHPKPDDLVNTLRQIQKDYQATSATATPNQGTANGPSPLRAMYAMHSAIANNSLAVALSSDGVRAAGTELLTTTHNAVPAATSSALVPISDSNSTALANAYQQTVWENVWDLAKQDPDFATAINSAFATNDAGKTSLLDGALTSFTSAQLATQNPQLGTIDALSPLLSSMSDQGGASLNPGNGPYDLLQTQLTSVTERTTFNILFLQGNKDQTPDKNKDQNIIDAGKAGLNAVSGILKLTGDDKAAAEITKVGSAVLDVASTVSKFSDVVSQSGSVLSALGSFGGAAATGNLIGAVAGLFSVFGGGGPSPEQLILQQVQKLQQQIQDLGKEMDARFDRVDSSLQTIYGDMEKNFAQIDAQLNRITGDTVTIENDLTAQSARLDLLQTTILQAMDTEIAYLQEATKLNCLKARALNTLLDATAFNACATAMEAMAEQKSLDPQGTIQGLAVSINTLGPTPVVDQSDVSDLNNWVAATEAYMSVSLDWPDLFRTLPMDAGFESRGNALQGVIQSFSRSAAGNKANRALYKALFDNYDAALTSVGNWINPPVAVGQPDFWGGTSQTSTYAPSDLPVNLKRIYLNQTCNEGPPGNDLKITPPPPGLVNALPDIARLADQLQIGKVRFMYDYSASQKDDNYYGIYLQLHGKALGHNKDGGVTAYNMTGVPRLSFRGVIESSGPDQTRYLFWSQFAVAAVQSAGQSHGKFLGQEADECADINPTINFAANPSFSNDPNDQSPVNDGIAKLSIPVATALRAKQRSTVSALIGTITGLDPLTKQAVETGASVGPLKQLNDARRLLVSAIALGLGYSSLQDEQLRALLSSDLNDRTLSILGVSARNDVEWLLENALANALKPENTASDMESPKGILDDIKSRETKLQNVVGQILDSLDSGKLTEGNPRFDSTQNRLKSLKNSHP